MLHLQLIIVTCKPWIIAGEIHNSSSMHLALKLYGPQAMSTHVPIISLHFSQLIHMYKISVCVPRGKLRARMLSGESLVFYLWKPTLLGTLFWEQNGFFPPKQIGQGPSTPAPPPNPGNARQKPFFLRIALFEQTLSLSQKCGFRLVFAMHIWLSISIMVCLGHSVSGK